MNINLPNRLALLGGILVALPLLLVGIGFGLFWKWLNPSARDWHDAFAPSTWSNWALVIVGVGATIAAIYTLNAIKRQARLTEADFDQSVKLDNWGVRGPQNSKMRINVDLINPTAFPMTFSGKIKIGSEERPLDKAFLSPKGSRTEWFDMVISKVEENAGRATFPVSATFIHLHRTSQREIKEEPGGPLVCERWEKDHKWHAKPNLSFRPLMEPEAQESIMNPPIGSQSPTK
jgi:hypothetical protein